MGSVQMGSEDRAASPMRLHAGPDVSPRRRRRSIADVAEASARCIDDAARSADPIWRASGGAAPPGG
eukprot:8860532-Pyramimonas_sp.AAC.1